MIRYKSDLFGLRTLFMWNGSATFRAVIPALISTGLVVVYDSLWGDQVKNMVEETYTIMVMISFFGFLLTTRLNFSYTRWWEAVTMCHEMTSKFSDAAACLAAYHHQSKIWDPIRPQSFGEVYASKKIQGNSRPSASKKRAVIPESLSLTVSSSSSAPPTFPAGTIKKDGGLLQWVQDIFSPPTVEVQSTDGSAKPRHRRVRSLSAPMLFTKSFLPNESSERFSISCSLPGTTDFAASDFLEEMVHLFSLLNAVAMASLRHDVEGCPSPLAEYIPNQPFPPYNSDDSNIPQTTLESEEPITTTIPSHMGSWWENKVDQFSNLFQFLAGIKRSPKQRTLYNAERPFHVLGGVSEAEAKRLQLARGHNAQVALCQMWLKEFIVREHLDGSTGEVNPAIISRIFVFLTEASVAYHQCSKIAFVPFPFPHEQMTSLFTWIVVISYPVLPVAFVHDLVLACLLNFATVLCFQGIYEVARELTNPYHTVPNDLPLNRFHAEFNESLRSLLMGYHPDSAQKDSQDHFG